MKLIVLAVIAAFSLAGCDAIKIVDTNTLTPAPNTVEPSPEPPAPLLDSAPEGMTEPVQGAFLRWMTGGEVPPSPTGLYVGLINKAEDGAREVTFGERQRVEFTDAVPENGQYAARSTQALSFAPSRVAVTVTGVGIWDQLTGGQLLVSRSFDEPVAIDGPGEGLTLDAGMVKLEVR